MYFLEKCEVCGSIMAYKLKGDYSFMLADIIRITRQKAFMSQDEFADELRVSVSTINRWETGKVRPNLTAMKHLKQFCEKRDLSYTEIEQEWFSHSTKG